MLREFKLRLKTELWGYFFTFFWKKTEQGKKRCGGKCNMKRPLSSV